MWRGRAAAGATLCLACAGAVACGSATELDADRLTPSAYPAGADASALSSPSLAVADASAFGILVIGDASPPLAPVDCTLCAAPSDCPTAVCVATGDGSGYCAPGCTKDGFCTIDRACSVVTDRAGQSWRACLPRSGCAPAAGRATGGDAAAR